jgi:hypothetical protein
MGRKKVTTVLLPRKNRDTGKVEEPYVILEELVPKYHPHLVKAKIAIAWALSWKPDADDRLVLGKCKKGAELERQMHGYDFVIILNKEKWDNALEKFGNKLKRALIDHELCHAQVATDKYGEVKKDEHGRIVYRIRKHDMEEFREIIDRHGIWKSDIALFAKSIMEKAEEAKKSPLLKKAEGGE